jgi:hypothetical protein
MPVLQLNPVKLEESSSSNKSVLPEILSQEMMLQKLSQPMSEPVSQPMSQEIVTLAKSYLIPSTTIPLQTELYGKNSCVKNYSLETYESDNFYEMHDSPNSSYELTSNKISNCSGSLNSSYEFPYLPNCLKEQNETIYPNILNIIFEDSAISYYDEHVEYFEDIDNNKSNTKQ